MIDTYPKSDLPISFYLKHVSVDGLPDQLKVSHETYNMMLCDNKRQDKYSPAFYNRLRELRNILINYENRLCEHAPCSPRNHLECRDCMESSCEECLKDYFGKAWFDE